MADATARIPEPDPPHQRPTRLSHLVLQTAQCEEMNAWFATGAFDRNFVGVAVDPEDLVRRFHCGTPAERIFRETCR